MRFSSAFWQTVILAMIIGTPIILYSVSFGSNDLLPWIVLLSLGFLAFMFWRILSPTYVGVGLRFLLFPADRHWISELYRYLAHSLQSGYDLGESLEQRAGDAHPYWLRKHLVEMARSIRLGDSLSSTANDHPALFSRSDRAIIQVGEKTGQLPETLEFLGETQPGAILKNVPIFLLALEMLYCPLIVAFVLVFIVPKFKDIYDQLGAELPWPTQILVQAGFILVHQAIWVILLAILAYVLLRVAFPKLGTFLVTRPFMRELYWSRPISRFAFALSLLLRSGTDLRDSVPLAITASSSSLLAAKQNAVLAQLENGKPLNEALEAVTTLPKRFFWFLRNGMIKEDPEGALGQIADDYVHIHDSLAANISAFLLPTIVVGFGIVGLFVVIALYLPLFNIPKIVGKE